MSDLDKTSFNTKLFRGLTILELSKNGVHSQGLGYLNAYTSTGHLKFGQRKIDDEEWERQAEESAKNSRIIMKDGFWIGEPRDW